MDSVRLSAHCPRRLNRSPAACSGHTLNITQNTPQCAHPHTHTVADRGVFNKLCYIVVTYSMIFCTYAYAKYALYANTLSEDP